MNYNAFLLCSHELLIVTADPMNYYFVLKTSVPLVKEINLDH
jgi:hypothetical protein